MDRAVFLDRDGVICRNRRDHVKSWEEFVFLPGSLAALARLAAAPVRIVVVTNQAVINRGIVPVATVEDIHARMVDAIHAAGGRVDRVLYCPHRPDEQCDCRKPQPGLPKQAAQEFGVDLSRSYVVGDALSDVGAAKAAGCAPYLVLTGRGWQQWWASLLNRDNGFVVLPDLNAAVTHILEETCT